MDVVEDGVATSKGTSIIYLVRLVCNQYKIWCVAITYLSHQGFLKRSPPCCTKLCSFFMLPRIGFFVIILPSSPGLYWSSTCTKCPPDCDTTSWAIVHHQVENENTTRILPIIACNKCNLPNPFFHFLKNGDGIAAIVFERDASIVASLLSLIR